MQASFGMRGTPPPPGTLPDPLPVRHHAGRQSALDIADISALLGSQWTLVRSEWRATAVVYGFNLMDYATIICFCHDYCGGMMGKFT